MKKKANRAMAPAARVLAASALMILVFTACGQTAGSPEPPPPKVLTLMGIATTSKPDATLYAKGQQEPFPGGKFQYRRLSRFSFASTKPAPGTCNFMQTLLYVTNHCAFSCFGKRRHSGDARRQLFSGDLHGI